MQPVLLSEIIPRYQVHTWYAPFAPKLEVYDTTILQDTGIYLGCWLVHVLRFAHTAFGTGWPNLMATVAPADVRCLSLSRRL